MNEAHFYEVTVDWVADRKGKMQSPVLNETIEVATPPEFTKGMPGIWSPEHLLVAAVNSCVMTTFLAIAENSRLEYTSFHSKAIGKLEMVEGKYMISEVTVQPIVTIADEQMLEKANKVLSKTEPNCLISNSIKSTVVYQPQVVVGLVSAN
jgi:peroxiredoxin-like protein